MKINSYSLLGERVSEGITPFSEERQGDQSLLTELNGEDQRKLNAN